MARIPQKGFSAYEADHQLSVITTPVPYTTLTPERFAVARARTKQASGRINTLAPR